MIISPNKIFADYISNVLPELGEEKIQEIGIEELASEILEDKFSFQTFFEQVEKIIENKDKKFAQRVEFKASSELLSKERIAEIKETIFNCEKMNANDFMKALVV